MKMITESVLETLNAAFNEWNAETPSGKRELITRYSSKLVLFHSDMSVCDTIVYYQSAVVTNEERLFISLLYYEIVKINPNIFNCFVERLSEFTEPEQRRMLSLINDSSVDVYSLLINLALVTDTSTLTGQETAINIRVLKGRYEVWDL